MLCSRRLEQHCGLLSL